MEILDEAVGRNDHAMPGQQGFLGTNVLKTRKKLSLALH